MTPADLGFGRLFATIRDAVIVTDVVSGRIVLSNPAASTMLGYSADELAGQSVAAILPNYGRIIDDSEPIELVAVRKDGVEISVDATLSALDHPAHEGSYTMAVLHDLSARRAAEDAERGRSDQELLRREEQRELGQLRQIVDTLPIPVLLTDAQGQLIVRNKAAEHLRYAGPTRSAREAAGAGAICHIDGTPYEVEERPLIRALHRGEVVVGEQVLIPAGPSSMIPVLVNAAPVRGPDGHILGVVASFENITAIKELERQKADFLAAAAHDLRTPVTSVKGLVQLLQRRLHRRKSLDQPVLETLQKIGWATDRITRVIDQVLDVARMEMGEPAALHLAQTDLVALLSGLVAEAGILYPDHEVALETNLAELPATVDGPRIERVISNLLVNAAKFSPDGGPIRLTLRQEADSAVISVEDRGIGIPPDELATIFERFQRASNVRDKKISGTGIGLTYAQEMVKLHGGTISVESREGQGSTFTVRLPLKAVC